MGHESAQGEGNVLQEVGLGHEEAGPDPGDAQFFKLDEHGTVLFAQHRDREFVFAASDEGFDERGNCKHEQDKEEGKLAHSWGGVENDQPFLKH